MYERSSSAERTRAFQSSTNEIGLDGFTQELLTNSSVRISDSGLSERLNTRPDLVIAGGVYSSMESSPSADIIQHEPDRSQDHSDLQA